MILYIVATKTIVCTCVMLIASTTRISVHVVHIALEQQGTDHYLVVTIIVLVLALVLVLLLVLVNSTNSDCHVVHITLERQGADHWPMVGKRLRLAAYPYTKP